MQDMIGELWIQTRITTTPIRHSVHTYTRNSKATHYMRTYSVLQIKRLPYYWRCLFSGLELDARYEWQVMPPNTHHSLF